MVDFLVVPFAADLVAFAVFAVAFEDVFLAAGSFLVLFAVVVFADFLAEAGLILAAFAILASAALRREAVFFLIKSFLTALSYSD